MRSRIGSRYLALIALHGIAARIADPFYIASLEEFPGQREHETEPYTGGEVPWGAVLKPVKPPPYYHAHLGHNGVPKKKRRK